jgi:hypothetical protein
MYMSGTLTRVSVNWFCKDAVVASLVKLPTPRYPKTGFPCTLFDGQNLYYFCCAKSAVSGTNNSLVYMLIVLQRPFSMTETAFSDLFVAATFRLACI